VFNLPSKSWPYSWFGLLLVLWPLTFFPSNYHANARH
jgi:hypothetical protein